MRAPPKVYVAMSYIQRCDAIEGQWDNRRDLTEKEEVVKRNALDYLNNYFLNEFFDVPSRKKRKKEKGDNESTVNVE